MKFFLTRSGALYTIERLTYLDSLMGIELTTGYQVTRFISAGGDIVPTWTERIDEYFVDDGRLQLLKDHRVWGYSTQVQSEQMPSAAGTVTV